MPGRSVAANEEKAPFFGIIGCYNSVLGRSLAKKLEEDSRFYLVGVYSNPDVFLGAFDAYEASSLDFCMVDSFFLKYLREKGKADKCINCKTLLIEDARLGPHELHSLIADLNLSGIIYKDTNIKNLRNVLYKILAGEKIFRCEGDPYYFDETNGVIESRVNFKDLLTPTEAKVVHMVCQGMRNKDIAKRLFISENTVRSHLYNIYRKFNIKTRTELLKLYISGL